MRCPHNRPEPAWRGAKLSDGQANLSRCERTMFSAPKVDHHMMVIWIDQTTRRTDGPGWRCGTCGEHWPRTLVGPPFEHDQCWECGGEIVTDQAEEAAV